jgi:hypothetical protein
MRSYPSIAVGFANLTIEHGVGVHSLAFEQVSFEAARSVANDFNSMSGVIWFQHSAEEVEERFMSNPRDRPFAP